MKYTSGDLEQVPFDIEIIEETALAMAQSTIQGAINSCGISRSELAEKMGRKRPFISRMLTGEHNLTIKTLARALAGCGYEARFEYVPIQLPLVATIPAEASQAHQGYQTILKSAAPPSSEPQAANSNLALAA